MAKVRFIGAEPHTVPELGGREVEPDEVVTVPDDRFDGYVCQEQTWQPVEEPPGWQEPPEETDDAAVDEAEERAEAKPTRKRTAAKAATTPKGDD